MKAAAVGQPLVVETVPDPTPGSGQLVVKVGYCGICGTDLHSTREGDSTVAHGCILGHEFVGEVAEVGRDLKAQWQVGERVCALPFLGCGACVACVNGRPFECATVQLTGLQVPGGFAEYVKTGVRETLPLPDTLPMESAALIEPLAVALHALRVAKLRAGQRVLLITGAGPIGLAVALWARFLGARDVVVSEFAEQRKALARKMGASAVIDPAGRLAEQFADACAGEPDLIFECVGAPGLLQQCVEPAPLHPGAGGRMRTAGYLYALSGAGQGTAIPVRDRLHPGRFRDGHLDAGAGPAGGLRDDYRHRAAQGNAGGFRSPAHALPPVQGAHQALTCTAPRPAYGAAPARARRRRR